MKEFIKRAVESDVPFLFWGAPGTGKTARITAQAKEEQVRLEVLIGAVLDPTDMGRPVVTENDDVKLVPPPWARRLKNAVDQGKKAWLFLDELTTSPPAIQNAFLRIVQERQVADIDLSSVRIIAAANPQEYTVDSTELSPAFLNRWVHVDWEVDKDEWIQGELSGWGNPDKKLASIRALVTSFIDYNPSALLDPPSEYTENLRGWPSPRSWSNLITALENCDVLKTKQGRRIVNGALGAGVGGEFIAWAMDQTLPKPFDLLTGKEKLPDRGDRAHLAMMATISYALAHQEHLENLWKVCLDQRDDLVVVSGKRAMQACKQAGIDPSLTAHMKKIIDKFKEMQ